LDAHPGESLPLAMQDWMKTRVAYRLLDNERANESDILSVHFAATCARVRAAGEARVLVLHDPTALSFRRQDIEAVDKTQIRVTGRIATGRRAPIRRADR
jgi:Transposase DNA-binding